LLVTQLESVPRTSGNAAQHWLLSVDRDLTGPRSFVPCTG